MGRTRSTSQIEAPTGTGNELGVVIRILKDWSTIVEALDSFSSPKSAFVFQSAGWLQAWAETMGQSSMAAPCFVQLNERSGRNIMMLPLCVEWRAGVRALVFAGGQTSDYNVPLVAQDVQRLDRRAFTALWPNIVSALPHFDIFLLERMPTSMPAGDNPMLGLPCTPADYQSYFSCLAGSWSDFRAARLKGGLRRDTQRKRRRLAEKGNVRFVVAATTKQAAPILDALVRQKSRRYRETGRHDRLGNKTNRAFYSEATRLLLARGIVHVSALYLNDTILATHWGAVHEGRFYWLMPSYETDPWSVYSPGRILLEELVKWCFTHGVGVFDFTYGDEPYKLAWSTHTMGMHHYIAGRTIKGQLASFIILLKKAMERRHEEAYTNLRSMKNRMTSVVSPRS
jgi:CelD/BcsL family acetyltransferase involved in cellulose biosynthesis